jgi:hypothetical protein
MKSIKKTLTVVFAIFLSTISFAQNAEFTTPEGIKWGMSISEVKKLKIDAPLSTQQDRIIYHDLRKGDESYIFENNKLTSISLLRTLYSKKELNNYIDEMKQEITNQYNATAVDVSENLIEWTVNGTKISLQKTAGKKGGIVIISYQP